MDTSTTDQTDQPPRKANWPRRIIIWLIIAAPFLALLQYYMLIEVRGSRELKRVLAELDEKDPGWRMDDLIAAREEIPDEENSALLLMKITGGDPGPAGLLPRGIPSNSLRELLEQVESNERLPEDSAEMIANELDSVPSALKHCRSLSGMPRGRFPMPTEKNLLLVTHDYQHMARKAAILLQLDAARLAKEGLADEAIDSCRAILNVSRSMVDDPSFISVLVRNSNRSIAMAALERALAQGEPSEGTLAAIQRAYEQDSRDDFLVQAIRADRAATDQFIEAVDSGEFTYMDVVALAEGGGPSGGYPWVQRTIMGAVGPLVFGSLKSNRAVLLEVQSDIIEMAQLPAGARRKALVNAGLDFRANLEQYPRITGRLLSDLGSFLTSFDLGQARCHCMIAALAAERYRLKHGQWPGSIEELITEFLRELPIDPYSGNPVQCKVVPEGLVIYAIGEDEKDSGGKVATKKSPAGADVGVRLWNIDKRGVPAKPLLPKDMNE